MANPQNIGYGPPAQHPQIANLQADAGVASTAPTQAYGPYATSPQGQPAYSPGPQSNYTPNGPSPIPSPYQQQQQQQPQQYRPYSTSSSQQPVYQRKGSGYFPSPSQYQPQSGSFGPPGASDGDAGGNLHPAHAHDRGYAVRPESRQRRESQSSITSHNSQRVRNSRRASQSAYGDNYPSGAASARRASYANDARASQRHRHNQDYSDDETVLSASSDDENDDYNTHGRRHSYGGNRSAYGHESRKRRGSHRSEAEIQADKDAIDKRPTLGDSLLLMYDTFKGAISGKRS